MPDSGAGEVAFAFMGSSIHGAARPAAGVKSKNSLRRSWPSVTDPAHKNGECRLVSRLEPSELAGFVKAHRARCGAGDNVDAAGASAPAILKEPRHEFAPNPLSLMSRLDVDVEV